MLYHSLADAVIGYGLIAYGRTFKTYLNHVLNLQLRLLKNITNENTIKICKNDNVALFKTLSVLPVHDKVRYLLATDQFNCSEFKTPRVYTRPQRGSERRRYAEPTTNNYYGERTRSYLIPRIFNKISFEDECSSKNVFKTKLKKLLLNTSTQNVPQLKNK